MGKFVMDRKEIALEEFKKRLLRSHVAGLVGKIYLHGSFLRGEAGAESDIDLLIFALGSLDEVQGVSSDLAFDVLLEAGERVEALVYCLDDYRYPPSLFVYQVLSGGKEIYSMEKEALYRREAEDLLDLSRRYVRSAERNLGAGDSRIAVDLAYNSAELAVKAMLLLMAEEPPRTHGGLVKRFGEVGIKGLGLPAEWGRALNRGLDRRNKARYDPHATITEEDARNLLTLAGDLISAAFRRMGLSE